jgi:hypothetical protein
MFGLFLIILSVSAAIYIHRRSMRDRPADRLAIEAYAKRNCLRIVSVTRSYNYFRYLSFYFSGYIFRGIRTGGLSGSVRLYDVTALDAAGNNGSVHIAFDPLFGSQIDILYSKGLALTPLNSK